MAYPFQLPDATAPINGIKYLHRLQPLLERLHAVGTARDRAAQRRFFCDHYVALLLLYFFNPTVTSLRGLRQLTELDKVQRWLGGRRVSLGALSEAGAVFDPARVGELLQELAARVPPASLPAEQELLRALTAVDGGLLPALPRMVWACWQDDTHRAGKLHLHFEVARGIPVAATVTAANASEVHQLRGRLQAGRLYVLDRGYAAYDLLAAMLKARAAFVVRLQNHAAYTADVERPVTAAARAVGVVRDVITERLGTAHHKQLIHQPLRLITVERDASTWLLVTDRLDWPAELIGLAYRYRWTVELFFRWLKCILGCRHWLGESRGAVTLQVYAALIATLLLTLATGLKPNKRTFEMVCHFLSGWATEAELVRHVRDLQPTAIPA